jgi:class 3 adenylate cyclase
VDDRLHGTPPEASPRVLPVGAAGSVVTFLMTDVVGSTAQWELAPTGMHAALDEHDAVISRIVDSCGGNCLKHRGEGDSTFSVFNDPAGAVRAAAAILAAVRTTTWPGGVDINVRASVYTGPAIERTGDYYGTTVNRAARLRSQAVRGQALISGATAELVRGRLPESLALVRVGLLQLQDIPEREEAFELIDAGRAQADDADLTEPAVPADGRRRWAVLPVPLRAASTTFTGRTADLEVLVDAFREARRGRGHVVFVGGDPGIGKTRLTAEFARRALLDGGIVAFGRADPEGGLPFRTFVDALSDLVEVAPAALLESYVRTFGGELTRIVPVLARRVAAAPPPTAADAGTERHRLFDAVRGFIEHLADDGPIVLLLDDLHDAATETVLMTRFLVDEAAKLPLLIVSTYRDGEVGVDSPLGKLLTHARRREHVTIHTLGGLHVDEVSMLVHELLPVHGERNTLAAQLIEETGGNPLFSIEVLRTLAATGSLAMPSAVATTDTVRDVIGRRVERLGPEVAVTLTMAAIVGRQFNLALVSRALGSDDDSALNAIEAAAGAHLVNEGSIPGTFAFAHGLIAHVLVASLSTTRRARSHLAVANAIDALGVSDGESSIDALARHLVAAGPIADRSRTVTAARRAGARAVAQLAPEQAADWFAAALERSDRGSRTHTDLLIDLGSAQRQAGVPEFRSTLLDASRAALVSGDSDLLLAAVVANHRGVRARTFFVDDERVAMLREAIARCEVESADKARALGALASELTHHPDQEARQAYSDAALELARRLGDDGALCEVLATRIDTILPADFAPRLAEIDELIRVAERCGDDRYLSYGLLSHGQTCLQTGDIDGHDADIARAKRVSATIRDPFISWRLASHDAYRVAMLGDLEGTERAALECFAVAKRGGQPDAASVLGSHLLLVRDAQGRLGEMVEAQRKATAAVPDSGALRTVLAFVLSEAGVANAGLINAGLINAGLINAGLINAGLINEARGQLDRFVTDGDGRAEVVRDLMWMMAMGYLGRAAVGVGHIEVARLVYSELEPWRAQVVWSGSCALGPVAQVLARTALVTGQPDRALAHARAALATSRRMRCPLWIVEALEAEALALAALDIEAVRRTEALAEAGALAAQHGFARFAYLYDPDGSEAVVTNA